MKNVPADHQITGMSAERLAVGDRVRCPKCRRWHPADLESSDTLFAEGELDHRQHQWPKNE